LAQRFIRRVAGVICRLRKLYRTIYSQVPECCGGLSSAHYGSCVGGGCIKRVRHRGTVAGGKERGK